MLSRRIVLVMLPLLLSLGESVALADSLTPTNPLAGQPLAQMQRGSPGKQGGRERLMQQLKLTDAQKQQFASIRQKYQGKIEPLKKRMQTEMENLRRMMGGNDSASAIRAKHQEIVNLRRQLDDLRFESMLELRAVLTPQQRTQFAQMMQHRRGQLRGQNGGNPNSDKPMPHSPEPDELSP